MKVQSRLDSKKIGELVCDGAMKFVLNFAVEIKGERVAEYESLDAVAKDWEDYKPAEPLIKDPKIRKAVRAWAEANEATEFKLSYDNKRIGFYSARADSVIEFAIDVDILSEHGCFYTITELCGEEEE